MTREEGERKLIETGKKIPPHFSMHLTQSQSDPHCRLTTPRGEEKKKTACSPTNSTVPQQRERLRISRSWSNVSKQA
jgi:hypothetical protein